MTTFEHSRVATRPLSPPSQRSRGETPHPCNQTGKVQRRRPVLQLCRPLSRSVLQLYLSTMVQIFIRTAAADEASGSGWEPFPCFLAAEFRSGPCQVREPRFRPQSKMCVSALPPRNHTGEGVEAVSRTCRRRYKCLQEQYKRYHGPPSVLERP